MRTDEVAVTALRSSQLPNSAVHRSPAFFEQASTARSANGALISRFDRHVDEQSCEHGFDHEGRNHWCGKGWLCLCSRRCRARQCPRIVLVDRTHKRAKAVATDLRYGSPLCPKATIVDGDYDDLADAALVMITAGINEKAGGAPRTAMTPKADCGSWTRTPKSIATSFRVSCARRLARDIGYNRSP